MADSQIENPPETTSPSTTPASEAGSPPAGAPAEKPAKGKKAKPADGKEKGESGPSKKKKKKKSAQPAWLQKMTRDAPGLAVSLIMHVVILFGLTFVVLPAQDRDRILTTLMKMTDSDDASDQIDTTPIAQPEKLETAHDPNPQVAMTTPDTQVTVQEIDVTSMPSTVETTVTEGPGAKVDVKPGSIATRLTAAGRASAVKAGGGSEGSEAAVQSGLKWLAKMQKSDGSWSFKVPGDPDVPFADASSAATSMALLAFLGGGHTHKKEQGNYQEVVQKGLDFLISQPSSSGVPGDLRGKIVSHEGMYTQGLAALAVCEAYALTKDKKLQRAAKAATDFIVSAQDPKGGGWRYNPGQEGDTSVTGWQIMALKSAQLGRLKVPSAAIGKATFFLNSVQKEGGSQYAYGVKENPNPSPSMTAVALLCRMYLGWTPKTPALKRGVEFLGKVGPAPGDIYYNYYATQVLHHWGGEPWEKWNKVMRDRLVTTQSKDGANSGSWPPSGQWAGSGGRLMETCLSVMTLEVYYRHLPLYQREKMSAEF